VHDVIERVLDLLEAQGRLGGVEVRYEEPSDVPEVHGHAQQLEQILLNLMLNAIDAMEHTEVPALTIRVGSERGGFTRLPRRRDGDPEAVDYTHRRRVATDLEPTGPDTLFTADEVVVIEVEDSGPGIDPEHLDRVFDLFFTTKAPGKGTGLGLAICARLADGMGGRVQADRAEGGGARFTIRLPAYTPEVAAAAAADAAGPTEHGRSE